MKYEKIRDILIEYGFEERPVTYFYYKTIPYTCICLIFKKIGNLNNINISFKNHRSFSGYILDGKSEIYNPNKKGEKELRNKIELYKNKLDDLLNERKKREINKL